MEMGAALFAVGRELVQRCLPLERQRRYWAAPCFVENVDRCVLFEEIFGARRGKTGVSLTAVSGQRRCLWTLPPLKRRAKLFPARPAGEFRALRSAAKGAAPGPRRLSRKAGESFLCASRHGFNA